MDPDDYCYSTNKHVKEKLAMDPDDYCYSTNKHVKEKVHLLYGVEEAYYKDHLKSEKTVFTLTLLKYTVNRSSALFEAYKDKMDTFVNIKRVDTFLRSSVGGTCFTTETRLLIKHLLLGVQSLIKDGLGGRIPTDPSNVVFLGDGVANLMHPKFILEVNPSQIGGAGMERFSKLMTCWLSKSSRGHKLAPPEDDFMKKLEMDKFEDLILHPGIWAPGMARRYLIETYRKFERDWSLMITPGLLPQTVYTALQPTYRNWDTTVEEEEVELWKKIETRYKGGGLPSLYNFYRNIFVHAFDWESSPAPAQNVQHESAPAQNVQEESEITVIEDFEETLQLLFPSFFTDFYNAAKPDFKFIKYFVEYLPYV